MDATKKWKSSKYLLTKIGFVLIIWTLIQSCGSTNDPVLEQDRKDVAYLIAQTPVQESVPLDLSDETHHRFYMRQLELGGIDKNDQPQLFKTLEETRQKHEEMGTEEQGDNDPVYAIHAFSGLGADPNAPVGNNYMSSGFSSAPGGTHYSLLTMRLYDSLNNPLDTLVQVTQEFSNGEYLTINAYGELQNSSAVHSIYSYYYIDTTNTPHGPFVKRAYTTDTPESINVSNPVNKKGGPEIVVCMDRAHNDCDYDTIGFPQGNVMFPLTGNITYSGQINSSGGKPISGVAQISLARNGGCYVELNSPSNFFDFTSISNGGKTLNWNIQAADFNNVCLGHLYYTDVTFNQFIGVLVDNRFVGATITNAPQAICDDKAVKCIPDMKVVSGCLAAETLITMANGSSIRIDKVPVFEKVLADKDGKTLTIEYTTIGIETIPIFVITDDLGHKLKITAFHAVPTQNRGVRVVEELQVGDILLTLDGDSKIVDISREYYDKNVWNLAVGAVNESYDIKEGTSTFFANRILVGDSRMQTHFSQQYRFKPGTILQKLPEEWHLDYKNYLKKNN